MAPRGEILDSDDEDYDLSPVRSPVAQSRRGETDAPGNNNLDTLRDRRAESTDPSFFRNMYDDQNVAANAAHQQSSSSVAALSNDPGSTFSPNPPPNTTSSHIHIHLSGPPNTSHLSSITDPVPASRRRHKRSDMKDVVDLTQITTPGRPTPSLPADIWDFPASQDDGAAGPSSTVPRTASARRKITIKLKKPETKRKCTLSSSIQSPEQLSSSILPALSVTQEKHESDAITSEPRQKKRRISSSGQAATNSQEVDLLIIPKSEDKPASTNNYVTPVSGENTSSIVEDSHKARSTSLMVVPGTTLTPSQRDEFKFVSLSSEGGRGHEETGLATPGVRVEDLHNSSGSATIKYPTPSEYASSGRKGLSAGDYGTASSSRPRRRRNAVVVESDPPSSPDIITAPDITPRQTGASLEVNSVGHDPYLAPSSPPPRSARRRGKQNAAPDKMQTPIPVLPEEEEPRASGRTNPRLRRGQHHDATDPSIFAAVIADTEATEQLGDELQLPTIQEEPAEKKKRGRKRKEVPSQAVAEEVLPDTALGDPDEDYAVVDDEAEEMPAEPAPKKRRGRPRKETQSGAVVIEDDEGFQPAPEETSGPLNGGEETPKPKKRRGRPMKSEVLVEDKDGTDQLDEAQVTTDKATRNGSVKDTSAEEQNTIPLSERDSNSNIGASPTKPGIPATDAVDNTAKENAAAELKTKKDAGKEETKAATTPSSQLGKVPYRVGLSRRSRIAPLLKSFRK